MTSTNLDARKLPLGEKYPFLLSTMTDPCMTAGHVYAIGRECIVRPHACNKFVTDHI